MSIRILVTFDHVIKREVKRNWTDFDALRMAKAAARGEATRRSARANLVLAVNSLPILRRLVLHSIVPLPAASRIW